ncbi:hypothetical protein NMY22_g19346 [Coprinellus aureogranulatus]|nr:hypothetical protein NMY22_g19346 [Coprinellus aureogranulatus]
MANQDRDEAFRSLVQTITKDDPQTKLSAEAIDRLTEKLGEIVGYDPSADFTPRRNDRGELVNEEGLPIIDITEPESRADEDEFIPPPEPIFRLAQIPNHTRNRLREQRNSILDQLEQEEREEEERERQRESEELAEQARKRAAAAASHKSAKELQKKMGKALLKSVTESKNQAEKVKEAQRIKDEEEDAKRKASSLKKKKSVKFADLESDGEEQVDWGDVVPGRIQPMKRPNLLSESTTQGTMKMNVVERRPARRASPPRPVAPERDSDDESDVSPPSDSELQSDNELEEEADLDYATLQRQVQLEYYKKRATIGQDAASLIQTTTEPEVEPITEDQLGITKSDTSKPAISQYRASRLLSSYGTTNPSSASNFVVPAASAKTLQHAIRTGKLDDDGKLVGGEDDSASEAEDDSMQQVLELLKRGEVYNIGPNGEPIHYLPPEEEPKQKSTTTAAALGLGSQSKELPPLSTKTPVSKFKVSRAAAGRNETPVSETPTPVNHLERSSPKASPMPTPSSSTPPFIVDSPSFAPGIDPSLMAGQAPLNPFSMIVDSPSFPAPGFKQSPAAASSSATGPAAPSPACIIHILGAGTYPPVRPRYDPHPSTPRGPPPPHIHAAVQHAAR